MGSTPPIYLDHQATTPTDPRVVEAMLPYFRDHFGNAASRTHVFGWRAEAAVEEARERIASAVGAAAPKEIVFTSGATESNNLAIKGVARAGRGRGDHLITVQTEHRSVLDPVRALEREGFRVSVLPVDADGLLDPERVAHALTDRTLLVSVMAANNEIGVLQPLAEIGSLCRERGVLFHSDAAQAVGKVPIEVLDLHVDLLSFTAHKLYGPKGIGALYLRASRPRLRIEPLLHGGGHERGLRSGTLAVPLIVGFATALALCVEGREAEAEQLRGLAARLLEGIEKRLDGVALHGHPSQRLPGNLNLAFEGIESDSLLVALKDVAVSSGSACTSASPEPSHVLKALGIPDALARASLRFGVGRFNTVEEIDRASERVVEEVRALRAQRAPQRASTPRTPSR